MNACSFRAPAPLLPFVCALLCLDLARSAPAQLVQDQTFDPTGNVTAAASITGFNTTFERAQTFTVGLSGSLTRVDAYLSHVVEPTVGNFALDIRATMPDGSPDPSIPPIGNLASGVAPTTSAPLTPDAAFITFELDQPVTVTAGQRLAIVLHSTLSTSPFGWHGSINNPYPGGASYIRQIGFNNSQWQNQSEIANNYDLGFRTFVLIPEPACATTALVLGLAVAARRAPRKRR